MLVQEQFDRVFSEMLWKKYSATDDKEKALKLIEEHSPFYMAIPVLEVM